MRRNNVYSKLVRNKVFFSSKYDTLFLVYRSTDDGRGIDMSGKYDSHVEPNAASGHVIEKCGLHFVGYGEFEKLDGSCKMRSKEFEGVLE